MRRTLGAGLAGLLVLVLLNCGGGMTPSGPEQDFTVSVSPSSLAAGQGQTTSSLTLSVGGMNGFSGLVTITIAGLPQGVTSSPAAPFAMTAGTTQPMTYAADGVTAPGPYTVMVRGAAGNVVHAAQFMLTVTATPIVLRTYQQGTRLYMENDIGDESARVGLETQWGGTVVEVSLNGTNFVNAFDTGREVQAALYDGNARYDACAGCTGIFGWDPVQGGDKYSDGSLVLPQSISPDSIYIKTQPNQWFPDDKGGGPGRPVLSDVYMEQWLSPVPNHPRAFNLHYKITHFGTDAHANSLQEFPAVYVNTDFNRFVYYGGASPWTNGGVTVTAMPSLDAGGSQNFYTSEHWGAFVDLRDSGLTVYVPEQYPYVAGFSFPGTSGPTGGGTNYFRPHTSFTFGPNSILEGDIYLVAGDYREARPVIYDLKSALVSPDIFTPFGYTDTPMANSQVAGPVNVSGWAFDDVAVSKVEVLVDDLSAGTATYGGSRPDVGSVFPNAPVNVGFQFSLDTLKYSNGAHVLTIKVTDSSNNVGVFPGVPFSVLN